MAPGLYVHVPFCRSKCRYCGFYSTTDLGWEGRWLGALDREARLRRHGWGQFDTVYVGGGSPSVLRDDTLERLMSLLTRRFDVHRCAEITIEVNPADVSPARARRWRSLGYNRASVGVQSFLAAELRWLGRRHDPKQAASALASLRSAGFAQVAVDLVQGLPGQSTARRLESVAAALAHQPEHLSCYELTVEPGTPLAADVAAGVCALPDPDRMAKAYLATSEYLGSRGYHQYEVSNFAASPALVSRHNSKYWSHVPYLGLGPAAHSFDGDSRWSNTDSLVRYCERLRSGELATLCHETLSDEQLRWERVSLGLRTADGLAPGDVWPAAGAQVSLDRLVQQGLLRRGPNRLRPTVRGMLLADALARHLLFGSALTAA